MVVSEAHKVIQLRFCDGRCDVIEMIHGDAKAIEIELKELAMDLDPGIGFSRDPEQVGIVVAEDDVDRTGYFFSSSITKGEHRSPQQIRSSVSPLRRANRGLKIVQVVMDIGDDTDTHTTLLAASAGEAGFGAPHRVDGAGNIDACRRGGVQPFHVRALTTLRRGRYRSRAIFSARSARTRTSLFRICTQPPATNIFRRPDDVNESQLADPQFA